MQGSIRNRDQNRSCKQKWLRIRRTEELCGNIKMPNSAFLLHDILTAMGKLPVGPICCLRLRLSAEHHEWVSINAPAHRITVRSSDSQRDLAIGRIWDPCSHGCETAVLSCYSTAQFLVRKLNVWFVHIYFLTAFKFITKIENCQTWTAIVWSYKGDLFSLNIEGTGLANLHVQLGLIDWVWTTCMARVLI